MMTVHEVGEKTGVSVRTLHHYDSIGLLKPTDTTAAGYRLYDDTALSRLGSILLFRELGFRLSDIKKMLDSPSFSPKEALDDQIKLLKMRRDRLEEIISLAENIRQNGVSNMDFTAFDGSESEKYAQEVKEKWGDTDAYKEYKERGLSDKENADAGKSLMDIFAEIGALLPDCAPESAEAAEAVRKIQAHITANFYTCTDEMLLGLGEMYVSDARMKASIDRAGGEGTAEFVSRAIKAHIG